MKQFPQDAGTGLSSQSDRDWGDAAHFAALAHVTHAPGVLISGCTFSVSYTTPEVTVSAGMVSIRDASLTERDHDGDGSTLTWPFGRQVYRITQTTVSLTDSATNHIYVVGDQANPDSASIVVNTTGSSPAGPSVKLGEIDTSGDTKSQQWYLVAGDGTLTFPTESAANTASGNLREGTVVYDRAGGTHYYVS